MDEPLGIMALIGVFGLVVGSVWAIGKIIEGAVALYFHMQRKGDE